MSAQGHPAVAWENRVAVRSGAAVESGRLCFGGLRGRYVGKGGIVSWT